MLPNYTKEELVYEVKKRMEYKGIDPETLKSEYGIDFKDLQNKSIWSMDTYNIVSQFLDITIEQITYIKPIENVNTVSFRADNHTEEIIEHVNKLDDIFLDLAYQIKIGGVNCD